MRRRSSTFLAAWLACCAVIGCNLILGSESAVFEPGGPEGGGTEAGDDGRLNPDGPPVMTDGGDGGDGPFDAGPCVNTETNANHCGTCGHDCLGGKCAAGKCQPFVVATEPGRFVGIALDSTHVYWTNSATGDVRRVPIGGGTAEMVYDGPGASPLGEALVRSGAHVYFTVGTPDGGVYRCPAAGCGASPPETVVALDSAGFMSVDDAGTLFVVEGFVGGRVGRCAPPCAGLDVVAPNEGYPLYAAGEGDSVYWSTLIPNGGNLRSRNAGAAAPSTLVPSRPAVQVAVVGADVIYVERGVGPLAVSRDGGTARRLFNGSAQSERLTINGGIVYFGDATSNAGRVLGCSVGGCGDAGTVLATNQSFPYSLVADAVSVYWTNMGENDAGSSVMRVAK